MFDFHRRKKILKSGPGINSKKLYDRFYLENGCMAVLVLAELRHEPGPSAVHQRHKNYRNPIVTDRAFLAALSTSTAS